MNLVDSLCDYLQTDITRGISEHEQQLLLKKVLKPIWLEINHTGQIRKYLIRGFGLLSNRHTFPKQVENGQGNEDGNRTTVTEYFREKYGRKLRYPDLLAVELYTPGNKSQSHHLQMERNKKWACVLVSSCEPSNHEIDVASHFAARFREFGHPRKLPRPLYVEMDDGSLAIKKQMKSS
ncbi:unnamed protein product [Didymodactylos carnosus]|uniref:PAZ domain-containing protein n=1 Tax=Didymodactylos carnosus TaxID=1234261 RepID=A0A815GXA1_9BILA|nr:unnamed protein product [Didymodactylos carnosus]CAF4208937.1 unnamed protein product [Didymodactylos carnosus]